MQSLQSKARGTQVSEPMEFVHLGSMIVPAPAYDAVLAIDKVGYHMRVSGANLIIEDGSGLDPALLAELKRWKPHAIMLLGYTADDSHLRQPHANGQRPR